MASCSSHLAAAGRGSHIPWMTAAQPAWPVSAPGWPPAAGGAPAAPPGLRSMTPVGSFHSFAPAPIPTMNRFQAVEDRCVIESGGAQIIQERVCCVEFIVKPTKPNKKRRGTRTLSCTATSTFKTLENYVSRALSKRSEIFFYQLLSGSVRWLCRDILHFTPFGENWRPIWPYQRHLRTNIQ